MTTERKSVGIRIEGTADQIQETHRRFNHVIDLSDPKEYPSRDNPNIKLVYYRGYFYKEDTLLDQLQAALADLQLYQQRMGELLQENEALKQQLDLVPKARPYDAVLGTPHRQSTNF